jgi:hypothetical protein
MSSPNIMSKTPAVIALLNKPIAASRKLLIQHDHVSQSVLMPDALIPPNVNTIINAS